MRRLLPLFIFIGFIARAQETVVTAKVTYVSSGTVYVSAGRSSALRDSILVHVVSGKDTIAELKVFAMSSKSSACTILRAKRDVVVGDNVVARVQKEEKKAALVAQQKDTTRTIGPEQSSGRSPRQAEQAALSLQGRVGVQYYGSQFDNSSYNLNQPGLVLSLTATSRDLPLRLDLYGNMRSISRGGAGLFSKGAVNDSRIYRLSLEYDDQNNVVTLGRILPIYAPSIGAIDGVSYARRFGNFIFGGAVGFQPSLTQRGVSTDARKFSLFTRYQNHVLYDLTLTAAYARSYMASQLDREVVSVGISAYSTDGLSIYGYSDIDLKTRNGNQLAASPSVSSAMLMINYRLADFITVGLGADASRPVYPFFSVPTLVDSVTDHRIRSGATISVSLYLVNGIGLYDSYTPRSFDAGFGKEYTNYSSLYWSNVLSSGTMVRGTFTMTSNGFTTSEGYGINLQRNVFGLDCTLRYQQSRYRILQLDETNLSKTFGADVMAFLSTHLSLIMSYDSVHGYGSVMQSVFTELSWRF